MEIVTYEEAVRYMSGLLQFGIRLDRERFAELLRRVGDPHKRLRCVHVAGTNGKGSTTNFVASGLQAAGYTVGAYFSPYVFDLRERIQINGAQIGKEEFADIVTRLRPHIEALAQTELGQTTEFELKTAAAFLHFAERDVDFAVVEVGIGGRLDSTNVIPPPLVAVITNIGLDHVNLLGDTLEKIAGEKAGILKAGTLACVTAVPPGPALAVIRERATVCGVPLRRVAPFDETENAPEVIAHFRAGDAPGETHIAFAGGTRDTPFFDLRLALRGPFQAANAATALAALDVLRESGVAPRLTFGAMQTGLERATLPGRFQIIERPLFPTLVLDVAHNEDGAHVLADAISAAFPHRPVTLVVGMSRTHEPEPFLRILGRVAPRRLLVTAPQFRPKSVSETYAAAVAAGLSDVRMIDVVSEAVEEAMQSAVPGEVVVVTGSFYTVGETPEKWRGATVG